MKLTIKQERKRLWSWTFREGRKVAAGGLCATRADAVNDAGIWKRDHELATTPKPTTKELRDVLRAVVDSYEDTGCDGCGTISAEIHARAFDMVKRFDA